MSKKLYIIKRNKKDDLICTESQIIQNALEQEKKGVLPHYSWFDCEEKEPQSWRGWLVWSTFESGCGVVYRRNDGKMIVVTGSQGDFCYC